jgi:hypothetical protein
MYLFGKKHASLSENFFLSSISEPSSFFFRFFVIDGTHHSGVCAESFFLYKISKFTKYVVG